jgi:hypothetical protein
LATPIFCNRPDVLLEIRLTQTNPGDWTPVWGPVQINVYALGIKPLLLNIADNILNNLTNSDLIQDKDWEQIECKDL